MEKVARNRIVFGAVLIFILAFGLRFLHIAAIAKTSPFFDVLPGDLGGYDRWAREIVEHGWLGQEIFYQDPLYPYFLALLYKIFGRDFFLVYTVQALLGAFISVFLVLLGNRIFGRLAGLAAGLFYALYGPAVYFDGLLLKVTLASFLLVVAIYFYLSKEPGETGWRHYFSGLVLGLACLARANFLLLVPVLMLAPILTSTVPVRKRLAVPVLLFGGLISVLGPVMARNYYVGGEPVLTTSQAGQNFYIGHNPVANGTYIWLPFVHADPRHEQQDFKKEAERRSGQNLSPAQVSRFWFQESLEYIKENPAVELQLTGMKLLLFFNNYEIPDNLNFYFYKRYSKILQALPITFGVLFPFFLLGFLNLPVARKPGAVFLFMLQLFYIISVVIFYVVSRYRMPVLPFFCLSAGYGIFLLQKYLREKQRIKLAAGFLILIIGAGIAYQRTVTPFDLGSLNFSHSYTDAGIAYEMKGNMPAALESYQEALEINPQNLRALERLADLQLHVKKYREARETLAKILALNPEATEAKQLIRFIDSLAR